MDTDTRAMARQIRRHALQMTSTGGSSHIGSVFSMADIVAVLYGAVLHVDPAHPKCARPRPVRTE